MPGARVGEEDSEWRGSLSGRRVAVPMGDILLGGVWREQPESGGDCWGKWDHVNT